MAITKKQLQKYAAVFSDNQNISRKTANKILDRLYNAGLDIKKFESIFYRIEKYVHTKMIGQIIDEMDDKMLDNFIMEMQGDCMIVEHQCYNEKNQKAWLFFDMVNLFGEHKEFKAWDTVEIQIMRTWERDHQTYGKVNVTEKVLSDVVKNFKSNARWVDLAVDENHDPDHKALWWFRDVYKKWKDAVYASIELTRKGAEMMTQWLYKYFSPEIYFSKVDEETGKVINNLLVGGAFTNRPFFKNMQPMMASEWVSNQQQKNDDENPSKYLLVFNDGNMNKFLKMLSDLHEKEKLEASDIEGIKAAFGELSAEEQKNLRTKAALDEVVEKFNDQEEAAADGWEGDDAWSDDGAGEGSDKGDESDDSEWSDDADWSDGDGWEGDDKGDWANGSQKHSEKKEVTLTAAEFAELQEAKASLGQFKELQKQVSILTQEKRKTVTEAQFSELKFNDQTKTGMLLPKDYAECVSFALSLSEKGAEKFFNILKNMSTNVAWKFTEDGVGATGKKAFSEEAVNDIAKKIQKEENLNFQEAYKKALTFFDGEDQE